MLVRKYCLCGVKLERHVADEETARTVVAAFRHEHMGGEHGPASRQKYEEVIRRLIARNAARAVKSGEPERNLRAFRVIKGGQR